MLLDRKEAIRKWKEQKTPRGIFAVRCTVSGQVWVGSSRNLSATKNGVWFSLRIGSHRDKGVQSAWEAHGEASFEYEVLETLEDDVSALVLEDVLKERRRCWMLRLGASPHP